MQTSNSLSLLQNDAIGNCVCIFANQTLKPSEGRDVRARGKLYRIHVLEYEALPVKYARATP
jgi:hypothetical protein